MPADKTVPSPEIIPATTQALVVTSDLETSIQGVSKPLAGFLNSLGLPTQRVLVDFAERRFVLQSLQQTLEVLPTTKERKRIT